MLSARVGLSEGERTGKDREGRVSRPRADFFSRRFDSKDPEKAVNYLLVAAKMGDVDAQLRSSPVSALRRLAFLPDSRLLSSFLSSRAELASCYLHGLGTKGKKDKIKSAFWFRAALAQGASDAGLSWVFKKKYMGLA